MLKANLMFSMAILVAASMGFSSASFAFDDEDVPPFFTKQTTQQEASKYSSPKQVTRDIVCQRSAKSDKKLVCWQVIGSTRQANK